MLDTLAPKSTANEGVVPKAKYRKPSRWTAAVPTLQPDEFQRGQSYIAKWQLAAPEETNSTPIEDSAAQSENLGRSSARDEDSMDDLELLNSIARTSR